MEDKLKILKSIHYNYVEYCKDITVYHVANPEVPGKLVGSSLSANDGYVYADVKFEKEVGFSKNLPGGKRKYWRCNLILLFSSPEEAAAAHDPEKA